MSPPNIQTKILRKAATPEEYRVYRAALEWDLTDPIVIESREDLKSEYRWRDRLEPYHHQVTNLITFCRRLPVTLLADDVGLGKTISAGLIVSELISRSRVSKILVVCPKILGPQWKEELEVKFDIPSELPQGRELIEAEPKSIGAVITTYQSAREHLNSIPHDRFQMLILDEAHKLRNLYGVDNAPQVAKRFHKALEQRRFPYVLMLTATPIQNRLWDLYSLVDLLTVARGHQNPFGSEGMFARKFIADNRRQARKLKENARDEFRSIVYGYMSRVRRGDAKLYFPDREVQMHRVQPTESELQLIEVIAEPIQDLNRLVQISILQALTSSPEALTAQLNNMAKKGSVPKELAIAVRNIVANMPRNAKLLGLGELIQQLQNKDPDSWRLVVFTGRRETQTTIQIFLEEYGLKVGIINGDTASRNQETIALFRQDPPYYRVIVSTESGAEGVNLQVANVLVNYDLPWNPMIVEQRIGRIQRLASEHANVVVFNIMLEGTFEEYIVGRLMEKLQMASHAIGDIDALIEASGIGGEEGGADSFEEKIRQLIIAALADKDVTAATEQAAQSIIEAKKELKREEEHINSLLGNMDGVAYVGPRAPNLPNTEKSMQPHDFTVKALTNMGADVKPESLASDLYLVEKNGGHEYIRFEDNIESDRKSTLYAPGTRAFQQLVSELVASGIHDVDDLDQNPKTISEDVSKRWINSFDAIPKILEVKDVQRCFDGTAVVRVRVAVAHDSYERLVEIPCASPEHSVQAGHQGLQPLPYVLENITSLGIDTNYLAEIARLDEAISEFCRFYLERREQEVKAAVGNERKQRKLEDDFTPRIEMTVVALNGNVHRLVDVRVSYRFDAEYEYIDELTVVPHSEELLQAPDMGFCSKSNRNVPETCLATCEITGTVAMAHLLAKSELSSRFALPEYTIVCSLSSKRILKDEAELSDVTGNFVTKALLRRSELSGKRAEPSYLGKCEFTRSEVLKSELAVSDISGKHYRIDEQLKSTVSRKAGHKQEFLYCHLTQQTISTAEAERCEVTGSYVKPGILETCAVTEKRVLPEQLDRCAVTNKRVLKNLLVSSSVHGAQMLEEVAVQSLGGKYCLPAEAKPCIWAGEKFHPDDLRTCDLTGLTIYIKYSKTEPKFSLEALFDLLGGVTRSKDEIQIWDSVSEEISTALKGIRCKVETAVMAPDKRHLAMCVEARTLLGLKKRYVGFLYSIVNRSIIGRIAQGRRTSEGWTRV